MLHGRLFKKAPWPPEASTIAMGSGMLFFVRCLITIWKLDCTDIHFMFSAWDCTTPQEVFFIKFYCRFCLFQLPVLYIPLSPLFWKKVEKSSIL
jgi:hypothetical protein